MRKSTYIAFSLLLVTMAGCTKKEITQVGDPAAGAQIKVIHVAPGVPALNVIVNGTKISPVLTSTVTDNSIPISIASGVTYLGVFPGNNYASVTAGATDIKIETATPVPALKSAQTLAPATPVGTVNQPTVAGGAYSVFVMGIPGAATNGLTTKIVEDKFPAAVANKAYVRFANMVPNGAAVDLVGTYTPTGGTATAKTITTATTYGNITDFVAVDVNAVNTTGYVFQMKQAGTTTNFGTSLGSTTTPTQLTPGRYYTIMGRGLAADVVTTSGITLKASARPVPPSASPDVKAPEIYFNAPGLTFYTNK